jgi:hypothetical protein
MSAMGRWAFEVQEQQQFEEDYGIGNYDRDSWRATDGEEGVRPAKRAAHGDNAELPF